MSNKKKIITDLREALDSLDITSDLRLVLIHAIEYLQREPASEDLEEYAKKLAKGAALDKHNLIWMCKKGAEWQKQQMKEALQTEYEKGRFDMREEMMKDAVDAEVFVDYNINFGYGSLTANIDLDEQHLKEGDKVKIIIVKDV